MGSIRFIIDGSKLEADSVYGYPYSLSMIQRGVDSHDQELGVIEEKQVPDYLISVFRAMQVAIPPENIYTGAISNQAPSAMVDTMFGVGRRSSATFTFLPTELTAHGHRAWVKHKYWTEGGGECWIGSLIEHNAYVAGFWLDERAAQQWVEDLTKHPLGKVLLKSTTPYAVVFQDHVNPAEWEGVRINYFSYCLLSEDDNYLLNTIGGGCPKGVYRSFNVSFEQWNGTVYVHAPELWQLVRDKKRDVFPLSPSYLILRACNGAQEVFLTGTDQDKNGWTKYVYELPRRKSYNPLDASGNWATFWPSYNAWEEFAFAQHIKARQVSTLHSDDWGDEDDPFFIPLTQEYAKKAWAAGATKLPAESIKLKVSQFKAGYGEGDRLINDEQNPLNGAVIYDGFDFVSGLVGRIVDWIWLKKESACVFLPMGFVGWIQCQKGLAISHATVVRKLGDKSRDPTEITVFSDGSCIYPTT